MITFFRASRISGESFAGRSRETPSGTVLNVESRIGADIIYSESLADGAYASLKFYVAANRRRYATLEAAAAAVVRGRTVAA